MELIGSWFKRALYFASVLVIFSAALAMAQSTTAIGRTNSSEKAGIEKSGTGASKWGPSRNVTEPAGPRAESAASSKALKSAEPKPGAAHAAINKEATSSGLPAGTPAAAGGDASTAKGKRQAFGTFSGKGDGAVSSGGGKAKKRASGRGFGKANLGPHRGSSGVHSHAKAGANKTAKHSTW